MEKKYELVKDGHSINAYGHTLYRIRALKDFANVKKGDIGGYIEKEENLSQEGNCWVFGNAQVSDCARVVDNAQVFGDAKIFGGAKVYGDARVYGNSSIFGNAEVFDNAVVKDYTKIFGDAKIFDSAEVFGDAKVYGITKIQGTSMIGDEGDINSNSDYINMGPIGNLYATFYIGTHDNMKIAYNQDILTIDEFITSLNRNFNDGCKNQYIDMIEYVKGILIDGNNPDCDETKESDTTNTDENEVNDALKLIRAICKNTKHCENCMLSKDGKKCGIIDNKPMCWKLKSDIAENNLFI